MTLSVDQAIRAQALQLAISASGLDANKGINIVQAADLYAEFIVCGHVGDTATDGAAPAAEPAAWPKTRGRKAKGEVDGVATAPPAVVSPVSVEPTPVTTPDVGPPLIVQVGTMEAMRTAVLALRAKTSDAVALQLLKDVGAENFGQVSPALFQQVENAATAALAALAPPPAALVVEDPFGLPGDAPAAAPAVTLKDVQAAMKARQRDVGDAALMKLLTDVGAVVPGPNGAPTASIKGLKPEMYATAIAKLNALPKTK